MSIKYRWLKDDFVTGDYYMDVPICGDILRIHVEKWNDIRKPSNHSNNMWHVEIASIDMGPVSNRIYVDKKTYTNVDEAKKGAILFAIETIKKICKESVDRLQLIGV